MGAKAVSEELREKIARIIDPEAEYGLRTTGKDFDGAYAEALTKADAIAALFAHPAPSQSPITSPSADPKGSPTSQSMDAVREARVAAFKEASKIAGA